MAERATNTFDEWLNKTLSQVQQGKVVQDALNGDNYDFVTGLETSILQRLHQPVDQVTGAQPGGGPPPSNVPQGPPQPSPMMSPAVGGGPAGPALVGPAGPAPMGGSMPAPSQINPDELRRVLGGPQ
jgi:hypothetical protein